MVKIVQTDVAVTNHFFLMAHNMNGQDLVHLCVMLWSHSLWDLEKISNNGYLKILKSCDRRQDYFLIIQLVFKDVSFGVNM